MNSTNYIDFMLNDFKLFNDNTAIICEGKGISYKILLSRIIYWREKLCVLNNNFIICLEGDFSPETIAILFALIERNVIIVPMDIHNVKKNGNKYDIAQVQIIIRVLSEDNVEFIIYNNNDDLNIYYQEFLKCNTPGLVLFTSGTSGQPKAALHDFTKLLNKFRIKRKPLRSINFLLFDHWGGLNTMFHILSNGGTVIFLENRNPDYVANLIEQHKVELLPASPTFLNLFILSRAYENKDMSSLKIISYGSEPMPENLLIHLNKLFPNIKFQQTYGLIELGVLRSKSETNDSLWVKIGGEGYETRVIDGILQIKSDSAMIGYLNAQNPFTEDGWFITGDSVEVNGDYYKILGRKSELINVGGEKVYPQEIENIILEIPEISDVLVYGEDNLITGKIVCAKVLINVNNLPNNEIVKKVKNHCRKHLPTYKIPVKVIITDETLENDRFKKKRM